jgi:hypothetical protein
MARQVVEMVGRIFTNLLAAFLLLIRISVSGQIYLDEQGLAQKHNFIS